MSTRQHHPWARRAALLLLFLAALSAPARVRASGLVHVKKVTLAAPSTGSAEVAVTTSATPTFSARVAPGGLRLLVDITDADAALTGTDAAIVKGNDVVAGVLTQAFDSSGQRVTRVLVQLAKTAEYEIRASTTGLTISLTAASATKAK